MWAVPGDDESRDGWKQGFTDSFFVENWHARVGLCDMENHRFLSEDFTVEETQFSGGHAIIANFAAEPRELDGITIEAGGFHIR